MNLPALRVEFEGMEMIYATANDHTAWRVKTLATKEPDTVAWIRAMPKGDTFVDIGANIGIYTILAAKCGLRVHAFEPEAQNYALLCRAIQINDSIDATAYCLALSDEKKLDKLYLSGFLPGGSCHTFGVDLDHRLTQRERPTESLTQGCMAVPFDSLGIKADHIKIDVDGLEHKVIAGAAQSLKDVKSVLIEINQNLNEHKALTTYMLDIGFKVDMKQVEAATRKEGTFKDCGNWIFYR